MAFSLIGRWLLRALEKTYRAAAGEGLQLAQNCNRLRRERHDMRRVRFGDRVAPFAAIQVHGRPLRMPQLAGAYEYERGQAQGTANRH
jgi:hypothetical protein